MQWTAAQVCEQLSAGRFRVHGGHGCCPSARRKTCHEPNAYPAGAFPRGISSASLCSTRTMLHFGRWLDSSARVKRNRWCLSTSEKVASCLKSRPLAHSRLRRFVARSDTCISDRFPHGLRESWQVLRSALQVLIAKLDLARTKVLAAEEKVQSEGGMTRAGAAALAAMEAEDAGFAGPAERRGSSTRRGMVGGGDGDESGGESDSESRRGSSFD